jgi:hypothetical protein
MIPPDACPAASAVLAGNPGADAQARAYLKSAKLTYSRSVPDRHSKFVVIRA